jgi:hypothetical protein
MTTKKTTEKKTFKVSGEILLKTVKDLIAEGNVRHITIKDKNDKTIAEFPLTIGVVATAFLPVLAAIGAIAALIGECSISVELEK